MRPRKTFEGQTTIVLAGSRVSSIAYLIVTSGWLVLSGCVFMTTREPEASVGIVAFCALTLPFAIAFLASLARRLTDKRALFEADRDGLRLHSSILFRPLRWSSIKSLSIQSSPIRSRGFTNDIRILLREPARGMMAPFGTREVRLSLQSLCLSQTEAADLLRQLRRLRSDPTSPAGESQVS